MSSQPQLVLVGGPSAVRYATTRSFILVFPLLLVAALVAAAALLATPAVAQKRAAAVTQAWADGGASAQSHLQQCLSERGKARGASKRNGNFFAHLSLLEDVEFCEDTVARTAGAGPSVFGADYKGPSIGDVETATQARKAVFSRTVALNKADFQ